jgi:hypothetical protein
MTADYVQYVIIQATDNYFGFDLLGEVEQACIFALIYTKGTDFINGWMVSKVMPQWVGSYSDWLAFEKQVGKVSSNQLWKIPQSVSYFGDVNSDVEKSNTKTDNSKSDSSEECFTDTSSQKNISEYQPNSSFPVLTRMMNRLRKKRIPHVTGLLREGVFQI